MRVLYRLTSPSDAVYVGQTYNLRKRMANYKSMRNSSQPLLYRSLKKYGFEAHKLDVLHQFPQGTAQKTVDDYERYAIQMHKNMRGCRLLNCSDGGRGTPRGHTIVRPLSRPDVQGEKHPLAKLSEDDVRNIRAEYQWKSNAHSIRALAEKYKVSQRLIGNVIKGDAWAHIKGGFQARNPRMAKFTKTQANEIRSRYQNGGCTHRSLAIEYGADHQTIGKIIRNPNWGSIHAAD